MTLVPHGGHGTHEEARPISTTHPAGGHSWCVEHDPSGVCLGDLHELPGGGAAWLEGAAEPVVVVALGRSGDRRLPRFAAAQARELAAALTALADRLDRPDPLSTALERPFDIGGRPVHKIDP